MPFQDTSPPVPDRWESESGARNGLGMVELKLYR